jgi:hypothetical protein
MRRFVVLAAAIAIMGISPADAAAQDKHKVRVPTTQSAPPAQPAVANRPAWASPQQCLTDNGYGRFLPCDIGDGR